MPWSTEQGRETSPLNFKICRWPVTSYIETVDFRLPGTRSGKGRLYRGPLAGKAFSSQRRQVFSVPEFWSQARCLTLNSARGFSDRSDRSARLPKVESWSRRICLCEEGNAWWVPSQWFESKRVGERHLEMGQKSKLEPSQTQTVHFCCSCN